MFDYQSRIRDSLLFAGNLIDHGLDDMNISMMTGRLSGGLDDIFDDVKIFPEGIDKKTRSKFINEIYEKNYAKVSNYKRWILNHGLLLMCSVFDEFMADLLNEILIVNPSLCLWDNRKDIISDFKGKSLKERYKTYINKLRIKEGDFFDFSAFKLDIQLKYKNFNFEDLEEIYKKRHKVAHTDGYILKSYSELVKISDIFQKLILILARQAMNKWSIETELTIYLKK